MKINLENRVTLNYLITFLLFVNKINNIQNLSVFSFHYKYKIENKKKDESLFLVFSDIFLSLDNSRTMFQV